jgi:hypothetical protein
MSTEPVINRTLKEYCTSDDVSREWDAAGAARHLHDWAARFNDAFGLELVTPVIAIERLRARAPRYQPGRNGLGLLHAIRVDRRSLEVPAAVGLLLLLRELLREWRGLTGGPVSARYYDACLRRKAAGYGLSVDRWGRVERVALGPFTELLERHGVATAVLRGDLSRWFDRRGDSPMKKWSCSCTVIRSATLVTALCTSCGRMFERAAPRGRGGPSRLNATAPESEDDGQ